MGHILGLDLGTNSIGWAVIDNERNTIIDTGSRIIPMDAATIGDYEKGNLKSAAATRTDFRSTRRLIARATLRRERLLRVLHVMGFLPKSFAEQIDFDLHPGQFKNHGEPLLPYYIGEDGKSHFRFMDSFGEMITDFQRHQADLVSNGRKVPYDWTIYYLRQKALTQPVSKEELAWIILNFNTKRGYYQLRGMADETAIEPAEKGKRVEYLPLTVTRIEEEDEDRKKRGNRWYKIIYDNGGVRKVSAPTMPDLLGQQIGAIVTTTLDKDGNIKKDKEGQPMISIRQPKEDDWTLIKKRTEHDLKNSGLTVGSYIYAHLLRDPSVKVKGQLIRTIERCYYKDELEKILTKQREYIPELTDPQLLQACIQELYRSNESHRDSLRETDFTRFIIDDIIFYQRPLKSKKSLIANCPLETYRYRDANGEWQERPIKCIPKSHPLYEEFRLWQFVNNLRIYKRQDEVDGKMVTDREVTSQLLQSPEDVAQLFDQLSDRKDIKQDQLLKDIGLGKDRTEYRWNYVDDPGKSYPCCPTTHEINSRIKKIGGHVLSTQEVIHLWHILYSVDDPIMCQKALSHFAEAHQLPQDGFVNAFKDYAPESNSYGAYSEKAIKRLLPLMRQGHCWSEEAIDPRTRQRIDHLIDGEADDSITTTTREKLAGCHCLSDFQGLPTWQAGYAVYGRHSEATDTTRWEKPEDIDTYLHTQLGHHSLRNPIVEMVICETLRVVRDIWRTYGQIDEVHVEMGRDLKQDAKSRARTTDTILANERTNLRIRTLLQEFVNPDCQIENVRPYSPSQQELLKIYEDGVLNDTDIERSDTIDKIIKELSSSSKSSRVSHNDILKYKAWLEQKYKSPYTGQPIPLSRLFTADYEIEHIIPQSRYFDDSFTNKVICESEVNKDKGNMLAYEYICQRGGSIVRGNMGKDIHVLDRKQYEDFVDKHYRHSPAKKKKLLLSEIPNGFTQRQLNDSRYMSKKILSILSCLVRQEGEQEATAKRVIATNGSITDRLKRDWGLNDVWNGLIAPRFMRLNEKTHTQNYGQEVNHEGKRHFQINVPLDISAGFSKKRLDHRHHAMDAIVIACTSRNIINYLSHANAAAPKEERQDIKHAVCQKVKTEEHGNYVWRIKKPWDTFTQDTAAQLQGIIISFKQNLRIITRSSNHYTHYENGQKVVSRQTKGDQWAIRKSLHKATASGRVNLCYQKEVSFKEALSNRQAIVDKEIKADLARVIVSCSNNFNPQAIYRYYKARNFKTEDGKGKDVSKVKIFYHTDDGKEPMSATRVAIDGSFNRANIGKISDTGIQKIMLAHLDRYKDGNKDRPDLAFSPEGIEEMNRDIKALNGGKDHKPIYHVRKTETLGMKFCIGNNGAKHHKYVEADKGTNLFFAIYANENGERTYESIPLNIAVERKKQGEPVASSTNENGDRLLFVLSPNDLVVLPDLDNGENIYKMVSCNKRQCFFVPQTWAITIANGIELGAANKIEMDLSTGTSIKQCCEKITVDRLGHIRKT